MNIYVTYYDDKAETYFIVHVHNEDCAKNTCIPCNILLE